MSASLTGLSLAEARAKLGAREVSAQELTDAHIDAIMSASAHR